MDLPGAEKAIKRGAIAGFVSGGLSLIVVTMAIVFEADGRFAYWNDPWCYLDVILVIACAFGVLRRSRLAAVVLILLFVLGKIVEYVDVGRLSGMAVSLLFVYFFARAIQGTFVWHRIRRQQDPDYRPVPRWVYFLWIPGGLLGLFFSVAVVVGIMGPSTAVITGDDLRTKDLLTLQREGILEEDEEVALFYSAGLFSVLEDGNVITDRRVISYERIDGEIWLVDARFDELVNVSVVEQGGALSDSLFVVETVSGDTVYLLASPEDEGDERFLSMLQERIRAQGKSD